MYELWLLSLFYRIFKAFIQFISKHWVLMVFAFFLGVLAGIAVGSFFISLYALLNHRQQPTVFNTRIFISIVLLLFAFYCLTTDFYKAFPLMHKATAAGNAMGLLFTVAYIVRFAAGGANTGLPQAVGIGVVVTGIALFTCNHYFDVAGYLSSPDKNFHLLLQEEKRAKYQSDFEAFEKSHYQLDAKDINRFSADDRERSESLAGTGAAETHKGTLLIRRFTALFRVSYYSFSRRDGYDVKTFKAFINGVTADYNDGHIIFPHGEVTDMDFDKRDYEQEMHTPLLTEIAVQAEVLPDDIDSYVQYREKGYLVDQPESYIISEAYLQSKGIPFTIDKF